MSNTPLTDPADIAALGEKTRSLPGFSVFNTPAKADTPATKVRFFVQVYDCGKPDRQAELDFCLAENKKLAEASNGLFEIVEIHAKDRISFREFFDRADALTQQDEVAVFTNSDIRFDETARFFRWLSEGDAWCLSRWDAELGHHDGLPPASPVCGEYGADVWAVRGKIGPLADCGFGMGLPFCDYAIAARFYEQGFRVYNPALSIRTWHHHKSGYRTYSDKDKVGKPWIRLIYPATLWVWQDSAPARPGKPALYEGTMPPYALAQAEGAKRRKVCLTCSLCRKDGAGCAQVGPKGVHCTAQGCRWFDVDNRYAKCPIGKW